MSNSNNTPQCPICKKEIEFSARYGNYVCNECVDSGTFTEDGRRIRHGNVDYTGGFVSLIEGETVKGHEHYCYIEREGIRYKIYADEARFGGIVYHLCEDQD
jgi:hypothetical protein